MASNNYFYLIIMLYTHDLRNSMNERKTLYKNISLILFSKSAHSLLFALRDRWRDILRERTSSSHIFLPEARGCQQRLHPLASSSETPLTDCMCNARPRFSAFCLNLTAWFSSRGIFRGHTPIVPKCPDRAAVY